VSESAPAPVRELRELFELVRGGELATALTRAPSEWRDVLERLAEGPDREGATLRAGQLPDPCLDRPFPDALCSLLHQGGYPARMLTLDPTAIDVLGPDYAGRAGEVADGLRTLADEVGIEEAIARTRNREYLWLARREVESAPLEEVGAALSELVGACAQVGLERLDPALPSELVVLGMGKLGGDELNFVSDIDLLFAHADDAVPEGERSHAAKTRLFGHLRKLVALLEGSGRWRPLFRVDLRLRPFGTRGPLSLSVSATESYYERHGRDWERQVWLRARPIAGDLALGDGLVRRLEPFVYRRAVSPAIFEEVAQLMRRARRDARDTLGGGAVDLKHDAGGIREVEFFVQGLQLLNGGRNPSVRERGTLRALDRLVAAGLLSDREHEQLTDAYRWLRRVEHRVQLVEGQQTHRLPADADALARLAARLEPEFDPGEALDWFRAALRDHRDAVMGIAQTLRGPEELEALEGERERLWARDVVLDPGAPDHTRIDALAKLGMRDPAEGNAIVAHLRSRRDGAFSSSGAASRGADRLLLACLESADPDAALRRLAEFASGRPAHFAAWRLLAEPEHTETVRLIAELLGSSEPLSRGLVGFRDHRDPRGDDVVELMLEAQSTRLPTEEDLRTDLEALAQRQAEPPPGPPEPTGVSEVLDTSLLRFKHHQLVRIGLYDLGRRPDPLEVGHALSDLADLILRELCIDVARGYAAGEVVADASHRFDLAIFALGKYGMQAMDYGSDLDLSFVFRPVDDEAPTMRAQVVRVARRLIARLEDRTHGPRLYEVDMLLRPSGRQGLLVSSLAGFRNYHRKRLPVWERLALLRLRPVAEIRFAPQVTDAIDVAPGSLCAEIERKVLPPALHPDPPEPAEEVAHAVRDLKRRIETELARETRDTLNPKTGVGGCLEAELLVGALQLLHPPAGFALDSERGIPAALDRLARAGTLARGEASALDHAYRFERRLLNRLRMMQGGETGDDSDRLVLNSPRLMALARRMGLADVDALVTDYLDHRAIIREALDRHLPAK
jgi:glutamate-ammonia-ligase adenylyltransferase